jgi:hypothetical protein
MFVFGNIIKMLIYFDIVEDRPYEGEGPALQRGQITYRMCDVALSMVLC